MSFFNSKPWAKIPTDLLENKAMIRTEQELSSELRAAPVLLYLAGATKADEDGIFDIGDGEEFAALIKVANPETVQTVARAMVKFRIFAHVPDSTIYLFAEWEYNTRQNGKSLKNRFNIAVEQWKKLQEESSFFVPYKKVDTMPKNIGDTNVQCCNTIQHTIQPHVNECFNTIQGAAPQSSQIRREQIRESRTEQIKSDEEQNTHTRIEGVEGENSPEACESFIDSSASGSKMDAEFEQMARDTERTIAERQWKVVPEAESTDETFESDSKNAEKQEASFVPGDVEKNEGGLETIIEYLNKFFSGNNVSYNVSKGLKTVESIADDLLKSSETAEQALDTARKVCFEFKKMHDSPESDRWHNIPLFPTYMAKEVVWEQLLSRVSRIYGTKNEPKIGNVIEQTKQAYKEKMADIAEYGEPFDAEYIRYGIEPDDPNRAQKLLAAKKGG